MSNHSTELDHDESQQQQEPRDVDESSDKFFLIEVWSLAPNAESWIKIPFGAQHKPYVKKCATTEQQPDSITTDEQFNLNDSSNTSGDPMNINKQSEQDVPSTQEQLLNFSGSIKGKLRAQHHLKLKKKFDCDEPSGHPGVPRVVQ
eukprot:GEZU01020790.1.p1 GENE.GEZU01020790.1~~GEZU01020790.1.p1  ORF type:complete len:146 (-),score=44.07 GEZU01020790.1:389-826(-)